VRVSLNKLTTTVLTSTAEVKSKIDERSDRLEAAVKDGATDVTSRLSVLEAAQKVESETRRKEHDAVMQRLNHMRVGDTSDLPDTSFQSQVRAKRLAVRIIHNDVDALKEQGALGLAGTPEERAEVEAAITAKKKARQKKLEKDENKKMAVEDRNSRAVEKAAKKAAAKPKAKPEPKTRAAKAKAGPKAIAPESKRQEKAIKTDEDANVPESKRQKAIKTHEDADVPDPRQQTLPQLLAKSTSAAMAEKTLAAGSNMDSTMSESTSAASECSEMAHELF